MKEKEMRPAVHAWLTAQGYTVIYESLMAGYCDMVGVTFAERVGRKVPPAIDAVALELKLRDVVGVLAQAKANRFSVRASYAAMPRSRVERMTAHTQDCFLLNGIGLLSVDVEAQQVETIVEPGPAYEHLRLSHFSRRWWNRIVRDKRLGRKNGPEDTPEKEPMP